MCAAHVSLNFFLISPIFFLFQSILADQESPAVYTEEKTTEIAGYTRLN